MAVLVEQKLNGVTQETYDAVNTRINAQGAPPAGMVVHTSGPIDGGWRVVDVWESADAFQRFREERLMPAVMSYAQEAGIEPPPGEVTVTELYDVIRP